MAVEDRKTHSFVALVGNLINLLLAIFFEACQKLLAKESKMSDLSQQKDGATAIAEDRDVCLDLGTSSTDQERMTTPAASNNCTLPQLRRKKVLAVRQQLAGGTYDLDEKRLDAVVDRLLGKLNA